MKKHNKRLYEEYTDMVQRLYKKDFDLSGALSALKICRYVTFQITNACNLRCSYCYEHNKNCGAMSLDTAKKVVDYILDLYVDNTSDFISQQTKGVVLDFIGGEPLLEAELIEHICDYWFEQCYKRDIPLGPFTRISFATNGKAWFEPASMHLFEKYHDIMSVTVSIDGVQELHDMYRVDSNGVGSFEMAWRAFQDAKARYGWLNSKMTFVPGSIKYLYSSVKMMIDEGCTYIHGNCAYEPMYTNEDGKNLYNELKRLANYIIDEHPDVFFAMFNPDEYGEAVDLAHDDNNYCGGTGNMLSFAPDGKAYPCIRYAPISIGNEKAAKVCFGDVNNGGLYATEEQRKIKRELDAITLTSQSTDECINCPVSKGCGWCSGYNYEKYGTANKRYTGICKAHKGNVLAVYYYVNTRYLKLGDTEPKKIKLPYDEVVEILGKEEADSLFALEKEAFSHYEL